MPSRKEGRKTPSKELSALPQRHPCSCDDFRTLVHDTSDDVSNRSELNLIIKGLNFIYHISYIPVDERATIQLSKESYMGVGQRGLQMRDVAPSVVQTVRSELRN